MKKLAKKLLCLTAVLALTLSLFTGCKSKNEKTLFEYAGQEVTFQEAHVYARIMQYQAEAQYGAYFGDSMWSMQVGTDSKGKKITMQQSVKDSVINQLKQIKVLAAHADDYNVKLTKSEKKQIKESVTACGKRFLIIELKCFKNDIASRFPLSPYLLGTHSPSFLP